MQYLRTTLTGGCPPTGTGPPAPRLRLGTVRHDGRPAAVVVAAVAVGVAVKEAMAVAASARRQAIAGRCRLSSIWRRRRWRGRGGGTDGTDGRRRRPPPTAPPRRLQRLQCWRVVTCCRCCHCRRRPQQSPRAVLTSVEPAAVCVAAAAVVAVEVVVAPARCRGGYLGQRCLSTGRPARTRCLHRRSRWAPATVARRGGPRHHSRRPPRMVKAPALAASAVAVGRQHSCKMDAPHLARRLVAAAAGRRARHLGARTRRSRRRAGANPLAPPPPTGVGCAASGGGGRRSRRPGR